VIRAAVALGSNLGDRRAHLDFALSRLGSLLTGLRTSSIIETTPQGVPDEQPAFLNAAAVGDTRLPPRDLLEALQHIERQCGRERPYPLAARTLDLDLILYGAEIVEQPDLRVPHPRFRDRTFVLIPLAEIAPDMRDPVTGRTILDLLAVLSARRG
jgi:2-amino-4-hydroxy-6-hydroxymethyldihydropteridine diphosphokinase